MPCYNIIMKLVEEDLFFLNDDLITYVVSPEDNLVYLRDIFKLKIRLSHALLARLKVQQKICVNGQTAHTNYRLQAGDVVTVDLCLDEKSDIVPQNIPLDIIYEDSDLLVINKPPGMAVHPIKEKLEGTLANAVAYYWLKQGQSRLFRPINRLDKGTSGLILVGKSQYAHQAMFKQQQQHLIKRNYIGLVEGVIEEEEGRIDLPIGRSDANCSPQRVVCSDGKPSITNFKVLKRFKGYSLLSLNLETGRTHQIRVHLSHLGYPLCGDSMYGSPSSFIARQALHANRLSFCQPRTGEGLSFEAPFPPDITELLKILGNL